MPRPVMVEYARSSGAKEPSISRVPRVVAECVVYLETHGLLVEGVFRVNGDLKKAEEILGSFASNSTINLESILGKSDDSNVRTVASLLKMYFRSMRTPLFPVDIYSQILKHRKDATKLKEIIMSRMPRSNFDALTVIMQLCYHISKGSDKNKMTPNALSICWAPSLIRAPPSSSSSNEMDMMMGSAMDAGKRNKVMETLISNFSTVFDQRAMCRKF